MYISMDAATSVVRLTSMLFLVMNYPGTWLIGVIAAMCSAYNFFSIQYYLRSTVYVIHILMQIYGWVLWNGQKPRVTQSLFSFIRSKETYPPGLILISLVLVCLQLGYFVIVGVSTDVYLDIFLTLMYVIALNLSIMRIIESWFIWAIYDVINAAVLLHVGLFYNALTSIIYLLFAIPGYLKWHSALNKPVS